MQLVMSQPFLGRTTKRQVAGTLALEMLLGRQEVKAQNPVMVLLWNLIARELDWTASLSSFGFTFKVYNYPIRGRSNILHT